MLKGDRKLIDTEGLILLLSLCRRCTDARNLQQYKYHADMVLHPQLRTFTIPDVSVNNRTPKAPVELDVVEKGKTVIWGYAIDNLTENSKIGYEGVFELIDPLTDAEEELIQMNRKVPNKAA